MLTGTMLQLMEQTALDVMILTDEIGEEEFFASRITRSETLRQLKTLTRIIADLPAGTRDAMPEIDWEAWATLAEVLGKPTKHPLQIWVAIKELTPVTVQRLHNYKKRLPQLFSVVP